MEGKCVVCGATARQAIIIKESFKQEAEGYPVCTQHCNDVKEVLRRESNSVKVRWNETCN